MMTKVNFFTAFKNGQAAASTHAFEEGGCMHMHMHMHMHMRGEGLRKAHDS